MEPEGSQTHSQVHATYPYPEPDQSSSCHHPSSRLLINYMETQRDI